MISSVRSGLALSLMWVALTTPGGATAQGVYVPMPGSAPAQTGPNLIDPSAPAPSAVTSPNALRRRLLQFSPSLVASAES
jgi:hypothetical protein